MAGVETEPKAESVSKAPVQQTHALTIPRRIPPPRFEPRPSHTITTQAAAPPKTAPTKSTLKALPIVRDHTTDQLNPAGDEYLPREIDEFGEKKMAANGQLQGGREYRCRTFLVPNRGDKLFMLATECARVLGYRDSYLLFNKHRSLFKIMAGQTEKDDLIQQEILPISYRSRAVAIVAARSIFRQFGSRIIVNGRRVRDDYWEAKARKQGFTEADLAGEKRPGATKAREATEATQNNVLLAGAPHPETVYNKTGPFPSPPQSHLAQPGMIGPPSGSTTRMPGLTPGPELTDSRSRDYYGILREDPRQEITGPAYQDQTGPSSVGELISQAHHAAQFNRSVFQQRDMDDAHVREILRRLRGQNSDQHLSVASIDSAAASTSGPSHPPHTAATGLSQPALMSSQIDETHDLIVRTPLLKGADINTQGGNSCALQAASLVGNDKIIQILLEKGVDINAQDGEYGSALQAASLTGHDNIVQILLERGADINAQGGKYNNALQAASCAGHFNIVLRLLKKGADVNAQGGKYYTALQAASSAGHEWIVRLLLENNADVNAQGGKYGNALQVASLGGYINIIRFLLEMDPDINAQGGKYGNALQAASVGGHSPIILMLLEMGAKINVLGGEYGSALQAASLAGHNEIVQVLLNKGADVNIQGGEYGSALQAAAIGGHDNIVQILLERGADINIQGGEYGSALQAAAIGGHDSIVRILLDKGADINKNGGEYGSALQAASLAGYNNIIGTLLEKGADINAQGGEYGNALQAASLGGHHIIVKTLLDMGANINAQGGEYGSAIQAASEAGYIDIVRLLLLNGAEEANSVKD